MNNLDSEKNEKSEISKTIEEHMKENATSHKPKANIKSSIIIFSIVLAILIGIAFLFLFIKKEWKKYEESQTTTTTRASTIAKTTTTTQPIHYSVRTTAKTEATHTVYPSNVKPGNSGGTHETQVSTRFTTKKRTESTTTTIVR